MSSGDADVRFLDPVRLVQLAERDVTVGGAESPVEAIKAHGRRDPSGQMQASEPIRGLSDLAAVQPPPDAPADRVLGRDDFARAITALAAPARLVSAQGTRTHYLFLMEADLSRILATIAIDMP